MIDFQSNEQHIITESSDHFPITGDLLRAARAFSGLSAEGLADLAGLGVATIRRAEREDYPKLTKANYRTLVRTFSELGIVFWIGGAGCFVGRPAKLAP